MAQDVEVQEDKPSNPCCAALQKKLSKLWAKYSKLEVMKNQFRECTTILQNNCDALQENNESLKKVLEEHKVQASVWKDERDKESGRRIDLEDEVSALQDEVRLLKQMDNSASQGADEKLQERLAQAEEEIKQLKQLLDQARANASLEKKKADEALEKFEKGRNKTTEAQKAEENRLLWEKLKKEADDMKSMLALEKSKSEAAEKKVEAEKQKAIRERKRAGEQQKLAETSLKKANLEKDRADDLDRKLEHFRNRAEQLEGELLKHKSSPKSEDSLLLEKLKQETDELKSLLALEKTKSEAEHKKVEMEKKKSIAERKRANLAVAKSKEQMEQAEKNLKQATFEKDRADNLNRKLEEAKNRAEKLELELQKHISSVKSVEVIPDKPITGRNAVPATDLYMSMLKNDTPFSQWVEKMLWEKEQTYIKEKKRADSEKKEAKKHREAAEKYKKIAMEQKHSADLLSGQLQKCKLRVEELQKELQESVSCRIYASNSPTRNNDVILETDTVKLLKKQLKLEKLLAKHAKEATKVEAFRNKILQQELCRLKQEFLQLQQRLNILDRSFLHGSEGIDQLEKIGGHTSKSEILGSDGHHRRLMSGIDYRMDPPYRGSNQKMLQSSAINSSSASFSDRPLVGSQERGTLSIMTSDNLGEDISNFKTNMSDKMQIRQNNNVAKADARTRSPTKDSSGKRELASREKKRNLGAVDSREIWFAKGENMHLLQDILKGQMDEPEEEISCRKLSRPLKKRKTSSVGTIINHRPRDSVESNGMPDQDISNSDECMPTSSPGSNAMRSDCGLQDGTNNIAGRNLSTPQDFDHLFTNDYMKLLDMDNAADEDSYRRAIGSPLSPMLPEVEFDQDENLEVGSSEILVNKSFPQGLSNVSDHPVRIETQHYLTNVVSNGSISAQLLMEHKSVDFPKDTTLPETSDTQGQEINVSSGKLGISYFCNPGNEGTIESCQNGITYSHGGMQKFFIVASDNKDNSSILRILQTICGCVPPCSFENSIEIFIRNIIDALSKAEDLSTREKACVFLSLILHGISELGLKNLKNGLGDNLVHSLGSASMKFNSALSDPTLKRMFIDSGHLLGLLAITEDFLLQQKVFVYDIGGTAESESYSNSKLKLILNGNDIILSEVAASAHLVVAAGSLLASLCSAVDHIGFVCEMSCNIIRMQKLDRPVMLAILHAFAHVCGSKYLTLPQYSIAMTVVKSLVRFLEKQTLSTDSTSFSSSDVGNPSGIFACTSCPFSLGAVSMEDVALMLLENLKYQCNSGSWLQSSLALVNLLVPGQPHEGTGEVSGLGEADLLSSTCDENICNFIDILSLFEVLASVMCWNWTSDHIVGGVCEFLELNHMEGVSVAAIILLGQLGRLGVDACGYEDSGVKKLRECLSRFACGTNFKKLSLPVQFAVITSLFDLSPIKYEEMAEGKIEIPAAASSCIREWFLSLNQEQLSFLRLHVAANDEGNYKRAGSAMQLPC